MMRTEESSKIIERSFYDEPDLCTIIAKLNDGTSIMKVFSQPVKYIDKSGAVKDKSKLLSSCGVISKYICKTDNNDILQFYSKNSSDGVVITNNEYEINMIPMSNVNSHGIYNEKENNVIYKNIFNSCTDIIYSPQFNGIKEDILINNYNGVNTYTFSLITDGLKLIKAQDSLLLVNDKNTIIASLGTIFAYDSNGKYTYGTYKM